MIDATDLGSAFERNLTIIKDQTKGLTHADSVLQPPFRGNCLNWVLGHIADTRNGILQRLGLSPILTDEQSNRYGYGSDPVCADGDDIIRLETLLSLLEKSQEALGSALATITPEALAEEVESFRGTTSLGRLLFFYYWHESYHVGQTELLRQLAGPDDAVI